MLRPAMLRGKEARNVLLGSIYIYVNHHSLPYVMPMIVIAVHAAKTNKEGKHADFRGLTFGHEFLTCPLMHLAVHVAYRLFLGQGEPLPESTLLTGSWCVIALRAPAHLVCCFMCHVLAIFACAAIFVFGMQGATASYDS